jgi:hypothetical protein
MQAPYAFAGGYVNGLEERFVGARIGLAGLEEWVKLPGLDVGDFAPRSISAQVSIPGIPSALLLDQKGEITFDYTLERLYRTQSRVALGRSIRYWLKDILPRTLQQIVRDFATPLSSITTICSSMQARPISMAVSPEREPTSC